MALSRHAKAPSVLGNRVNRSYGRYLRLGVVGGSRPSVDEWLTPPAPSGNATVTPSAVAVTVAIPQATPRTAALWFGADGGWVSSTGDPAATYPTVPDANCELVLIAIGKPSSANAGTLATPAGYTLQTSLTGANDGDTGGYGATLATDTGNVNLYAFTKDTVTGSESGTVTVDFSTTNNGSGCIIRLDKRAGDTIDWAAATGKDVTGDDVSITTGTLDLAPGDFLLWGMGNPSDAPSVSAHAISASGITFGTVTELNELDSTQGTDLGGYLAYAEVTAGTGTVAPTFTATTGGTATDMRGPGFILRGRVAGAGGNATVTPTAVAATATVPAAAVSVGATPAAVAATAAMPPATARGGATVSPAAVATTTTVPAPTLATGSAATPAAVAAVATIGAPAVSVGAAPNTVTAVTTVPAPTAGQTGGGGATPTPTAVASTTTVPKPNVGVGATAAAVAITATVPAPTALTGAARAPATVAATVAVPGPSVAVGAAPSAVAAFVAMPAPTVFVGAGSAPGSVAAVATVPKANVSVGVAPARVIATTTVPAPTVVLGFTVGPAAVVVVATTPKPNVGVGVAPAAVVVLVGIGTPTIPGGATGTWSWYLRRSGGWQQSSPLLDGTHPTTTDVT